MSKDAYLLFYVKKDINSFHRQSVSLPENWPFLQKLALANSQMGSPTSQMRNIDSRTEIRSRVQSINKSALPLLQSGIEKRNSVFMKRRESSVSGGQNLMDLVNQRAAKRHSIMPLGASIHGASSFPIPVIIESNQER